MDLRADKRKLSRNDKNESTTRDYSRNISVNNNCLDCEARQDEECIVIELDPEDFFPDDMRYHDPEEPRDDNTPCDICGKRYKGFKTLDMHMRDKHGVENYRKCYPCQCCSMIFFNGDQLLPHYEEHMDEHGYFPCPEGCGFSFSSWYMLIQHKRNFHPDLGTLGFDWFNSWCGI